MDRLAELVLDGAELDEALEVMRNLVDCCSGCQAEFEALIAVLSMELADGERLNLGKTLRPLRPPTIETGRASLLLTGS